MIDGRVITPLKILQETFHGPSRLIQKRMDKHLDFSSATLKLEKNKDYTKTKTVLLLTHSLL